MSDDLNVEKIYIQDVFNDYLDDVYRVNRKYQRKLVWTLNEKQFFINTILHKYPVPLFLFVKYKDNDNSRYNKDIIDGLQRINAILSFIKNEFKAKHTDGNYYYFNVSALSGGEDYIKQGILKQKEPSLDITESRKFLLYPLPVSITEKSDLEVEDIFKRINSTGKKLSKQDLRQAGSISLFSDLVRKTATYVRGDITDDIIPLSMMPSISWSNRKLNYEINIKDSFWMKHKILTDENIRISRDEEIIARIYSYMILGDKISPSSETLTNIYTQGTSQYNQIEKFLKDTMSVRDMMEIYSKVYSDFVKIFDSVNSTFSKWLFSNEEVKGKQKIFQAIFLALYDLRKENYFIEDFYKTANALEKIGNTEFSEVTDNGSWSAKIRNNSIRRIKSIIQKTMVKRVQVVNNEWKYKLEEYIFSYGVEKQMFDFKLGLTTLKTQQRNSNIVPEIVKTLTAMSNTKPDKEGIVIIGVANDEDSAKQFCEHYRTNYIYVSGCCVTGVDAEVKKYWKDLDEYMMFIKNSISNTNIQPDVKNDILCNFEPIIYEGKTLILLKCKCLGHASIFDNEYYERHGSSTELVKNGTVEFFNLVKRTMENV